MKRFFASVAVMMLAGGLYADSADSYLLWMLDDTAGSPQFAYAMLVADDGTDRVCLTTGNTGNPIVFDADTTPETRRLTEIYSLLPKDSSAMSFFVELFNEDGMTVGVSSAAAYADLSSFIYSDMGTSGIRSPYHFTAAIPEPSGGLLFLLGIGIVAVRRRKTANPAHPSP